MQRNPKKLPLIVFWVNQRKPHQLSDCQSVSGGCVSTPRGGSSTSSLNLPSSTRQLSYETVVGGLLAGWLLLVG